MWFPTRRSRVFPLLSAGQSTVNHGTFYVSLKPDAERKLSALQVIARMRQKLDTLAGLRVYFFPVQDLRAGARQGKAQYQFTLWDPNFAELVEWFPKVLERIRKVPGLVDVTSDREKGGLEANVEIDRTAASRLGVAIQDIDNALGNSYAQKQISTIFSQRNQYRVVLEVDPFAFTRPSDFADLYVPGRGGVAAPVVGRRPVSSAPRRRSSSTTKASFPSITITYNLTPNTPVGLATDAVQKAVDEMHLPAGLHAEFAGDAKAIADNSSGQGVLILVALLAVYIVLGVLYESLVHPVTIISTLPSAGLGALIAINAAGLDLDGDRLHRHRLADRHRQEERHHARGFRHPCGTRAGLDAVRIDLRGLRRALSPDLDDDVCCALRRHPARRRDGGGRGASAPARHHHRGRPHPFAGAYALHHARDLLADVEARALLAPPPIAGAASRARAALS